MRFEKFKRRGAEDAELLNAHFLCALSVSAFQILIDHNDEFWFFLGHKTRADPIADHGGN